MPRSEWICCIGVALEIRSPLSVHFDIHLKHEISTIQLISLKLGNILALKTIGLLPALKRIKFPRHHKPRIPANISCVFVRKIIHSLHGHAVIGLVGGFGCIDGALTLAEAVAVAA